MLCNSQTVLYLHKLAIIYKSLLHTFSASNSIPKNFHLVFSRWAPVLPRSRHDQDGTRYTQLVATGHNSPPSRPQLTHLNLFSRAVREGYAGMPGRHMCCNGSNNSSNNGVYMSMR